MQKISLENLFLLDIETVSSKENFHLLEVEWKDLWVEKIKRNLHPDMTAEDLYIQKAAILAEFARVVCISYAYLKKENEDWEIRIKSIYGHDEKELLMEFSQTILKLPSKKKQWIFTGHNIKEFDIPFLCRRMLANQLSIPQQMDFQNQKPWDTPILDTLQLWRFGDYKNYTSLKLLAAVLGVPSPKDDIDGSQVGNVYWKENDLERIARYCEKDVLTLGNIMLRFHGLPLLKENQIMLVK
jgi:DNA polymerase elongation subunit (family B)